MYRSGPTTSVETLDALLTANAELAHVIMKLQEEIEYRDRALAECQNKLNQYWDFREDIDYRSLVGKIRKDARSVGEVLRTLDTGTRRTLARLGADRDAGDSGARVSEKRLLPAVQSLLQTLDEWE